MRRKKVLVHGTLDTLQKFFSDASSRDFDIVAILSDEPEKIDAESLDVLATQNLPAYVLKIIDGIILTDATNKNLIMYFLEQGLESRKIILWNENKGWDSLIFSEDDDTQVIYIYGLEFHIRNDDDAKFFRDIKNFIYNQWRMKNLNPSLYAADLTQCFQEFTGKPFDINNPQTYTEKMQWLKLYDSTSIKSRLADKCLVRTWIAEKIGEGYSIPLLGMWDDFDAINFDDLPNQFVLKCNHGSGMNIVVRDKKTFDKQRAREKFNAWLAINYGAAYGNFELHYNRISRRIIAEKFMQHLDTTDLVDYKVWCFGGVPVIVQCETNRSTALRSNYFDTDFKPFDFISHETPRGEHPELIPKPKNFELMKEIAETLSKDFAHVRVDFFEVNGRLYVAEMSFTPFSGFLKFNPESVDKALGDLLNLPAPSPMPTY